MNKHAKLLLNCAVVAGLVAAGVYLSLSLPHVIYEPVQWFNDNFGRAMALTLWFLYGVLLWGVFGTVIAWLMLFLKPQNVLLYGVVAAVSFLVTMQSWNLLASYQPYAFFRELVYAMTVPFLYWLMVKQRFPAVDQIPE